MRNQQYGKRKGLAAGLLITGILMAGGTVWAEPGTGNPGTETKENYRDRQESAAYADVNTCLNVRAGAGTQYSILAQLPKNGYCEIIKEEGPWCYVSSGETEGYVFKEYLVTGLTKEEYLEATGLSEAVYAYSLNETPAETVSALPKGKGQAVVDYALQFVGNPYVWGGTSLTEGADCSGFVQSVYRDFGVSLPRVASEQANAGTRIPVSEAQPGDLIFYADNGEIYHVVLYMGNGQVVHASSAATGIKVSEVYWEKAVWAVKMT